MLQTRLDRETEKNSGMGTVNAIQKELDALMSENNGRMGILSDKGGIISIVRCCPTIIPD